MDENNEEMILGIETNSDVKFCVPEDDELCPGSTSLLDKLHQVLGPFCDLDCWICKDYINQLSQHIEFLHRNDGDEDEREHDNDSPHVEAQFSLSPMDSDLLPECDDQIEEKCEPFLQELEGPTLPKLPIPLPLRKRGRPKNVFPEPVQIRKSLRTNVKRTLIFKKIKKEKVIKKVKKTPEGKIKSRQEKLTCTFCQKIFNRSYHLKVHLRTHTGEKPYKCDTCQIYFRHRERLKLHERVAHTRERPFVCTICSKGFARAYLLKIHVQRTHSIERPYKCDICTRTFAIQKNLSKHKIIHGVKTFMCEICSARFVSNESLKIHTKTHREKPFVCDHCGKKMANQKSLRYHIDSMHKEQPSLPCDECEQKFTDPNQLFLHKRIHTGDKHKVIQCDHCPKLFLKGRNSGRWQHMQSHNAENTFECDQCHKTFKSKLGLQKHSLKHTTGVVEKSEKCKECGKSYDMPYLLRLHIRRVHTKQTKQQEQGDECSTVINPSLHD